MKWMHSHSCIFLSTEKAKLVRRFFSVGKKVPWFVRRTTWSSVGIRIPCRAEKWIRTNQNPREGRFAFKIEIFFPFAFLKVLLGNHRTLTMNEPFYNSCYSTSSGHYTKFFMWGGVLQAGKFSVLCTVLYSYSPRKVPFKARIPRQNHCFFYVRVATPFSIILSSSLERLRNSKFSVVLVFGCYPGLTSRKLFSIWVAIISSIQTTPSMIIHSRIWLVMCAKQMVSSESQKGIMNSSSCQHTMHQQ